MNNQNINQPPTAVEQETRDNIQEHLIGLGCEKPIFKLARKNGQIIFVSFKRRLNLDGGGIINLVGDEKSIKIQLTEWVNGNN